MDSHVLSDETYNQFASLVAAASTGIETKGRETSDVVEFELTDAPGIFLGLDPHGTDDDALFTVYMFIADTQQYTTQDGSIHNHPTVKTVREELRAATETGFETGAVDPEKVRAKMQVLSDEGQPGRYYILDVPTAAQTDTVQDEDYS